MRVVQRLLSKPVIASGLVALAIAVIGWTLHSRNGHKVLFNTAAVKRADLAATISATGTIEPVEVVDVGAQVAGLILSFGKDKDGRTIDYGSIVEEGTVLAKIDDSVYAADRALARAQVEQEKAGELQQMKAKLVQTEAE
jgi:HlyD family secretion protein